MSELILHLATGNAHKATEFQRLADASGLALRIVPAAPMPAVVEDSGTFIGNARKKAVALCSTLPPGTWVLADDSGLCVDALGGAPGVESAYYAGPQADGAANLRKLVDVMREVPTEQRAAHFVCVLVLLDGAGMAHHFEGRCAGVLIDVPKGGRGFGYDPLFVPMGEQISFAELAEERKNQLSHRGQAWAQLADWLRMQPTIS